MQYVTADKPPQDLLNTATNRGGSLREMMRFIYLHAKQESLRAVSMKAGLHISVERAARPTCKKHIPPVRNEIFITGAQGRFPATSPLQDFKPCSGCDHMQEITLMLNPQLGNLVSQ